MLAVGALAVLALAGLSPASAAGILPANYIEIVKNATKEAQELKLQPFSWSEGVSTYEPTEDLLKELVWYHAGYDHEKRPYFVIDLGHWDQKKWVDAGGENATNFDKYFEKFWWTMANTPPKDADGQTGFSLIMDSKDFQMKNLGSLNVVRNNLLQARRAEQIQASMEHLWIVNMNFVGQTYVNLIKPIAGNFLGKSQQFGPQLQKYAPILLNKIPKDQLPEKYGGSKDFKAVKMYGR